jgi:hypothetical protein
VEGSIRKSVKVKADVMIIRIIPIFPTLITDILSLIVALTTAPIIHPNPSAMRIYPTFRLVLYY